MLEVLVVLKSQKFDPNNTNEWLKMAHGALIWSKLDKVKVNEACGSSITKCRKKYMSIKANYALQVKLDKFTTGSGNTFPIMYAEYMNVLFEEDNAICNPDLVIDGNVKQPRLLDWTASNSDDDGIM